MNDVPKNSPGVHYIVMLPVVTTYVGYARVNRVTQGLLIVAIDFIVFVHINILTFYFHLLNILFDF